LGRDSGRVSVNLVQLLIEGFDLEIDPKGAFPTPVGAGCYDS